jgi:hypothetical protein
MNDYRELIAKELYMWFGSCGEPDAEKWEDLTDPIKDRYLDATESSIKLHLEALSKQEVEGLELTDIEIEKAINESDVNPEFAVRKWMWILRIPANAQLQKVLPVVAAREAKVKADTAREIFDELEDLVLIYREVDGDPYVLLHGVVGSNHYKALKAKYLKEG